MNEFDIVVEATDNYIENTDVDDVRDFSFTRNLNNIILSRGLKEYNMLFRRKIHLKDSIKYVSDFLSKINPEYQEYFIERLKDGTFNFDYDNEEISPYSELNLDNNESLIYIPVQNTIEDAYAIIHELMHDMNIERNDESLTRYLFTEMVSILSEFVLEDYLIEKKVKDARIVNNRNLFFAYEKAIEVDINLNLLESRMLNGYINKGMVINIFNDYPEVYIPNIADTISEICKLESLTIDEERPYIVGIVIATHIYDKLKKDKRNIRELFDLNEMIRTNSIDQILDYLDFEYDEYDLTKDSYKVLKKSYKKYLKSR